MVDTATIVKVGTALGAGLLAAFKLVPTAKTAYEWLSKRNADKKAQPKLALSLHGGSRSRFRCNDRIYAPFPHEPGEPFTLQEQEWIQYDWELSWRFRLNITNQAEHVGYKVRLIAPAHPGIRFTISPEIDYTKPFVSHKTEVYDITCTTRSRGTGAEADVILHEYPFEILRIEYANTKEVRFATEFYPAKEDEQKNVYSSAK
jgi:hypothetical protein